MPPRNKPTEIIKDFGRCQVMRDTATGMPICNCPGGRYGMICHHIREVDPKAKAVWEE